MTRKPFLHDRDDFRDLITIVASNFGVAEALVEKDYWVTHTLWSLEQAGLTVLFKGGTSLSKGYDLIERFSEDIDLKIESRELPEVTSWTSASKGAIRSREAFFQALLRRIQVPGATVSELDAVSNDPKRRNVVIKVDYGGQFLENLPESLSAFVQIEVGSARVNPGEPRPLSSWIHTFVHQSAPQVAAECTDNRVTLHCVYPSVTLLEKIEAISRCFGQEKPAASFVRHYEDAAQILQQSTETTGELKKLLQSLLDDSDIKRWPSPTHPAFLYDPTAVRWIQLEGAWRAIAPMYWGKRVELSRCSELIREFLERLAE